jgi:hypothetical protein
MKTRMGLLIAAMLGLSACGGTVEDQQVDEMVGQIENAVSVDMGEDDMAEADATTMPVAPKTPPTPAAPKMLSPRIMVTNTAGEPIVIEMFVIFFQPGAGVQVKTGRTSEIADKAVVTFAAPLLPKGARSGRVIIRARGKSGKFYVIKLLAPKKAMDKMKNTFMVFGATVTDKVIPARKPLPPRRQPKKAPVTSMPKMTPKPNTATTTPSPKAGPATTNPKQAA